MPSFPQKMLLSLQYISNFIGKIIQTRRGQCTHCNISQNCVSKCTRLHLSAYSFQKISGGACPKPPLGRSWPSATWDLILDRTLLCKEEGLAELVSVQSSVQEVPSLIPTCDLKSFFRLLSFPCSFKLNTC